VNMPTQTKGMTGVVVKEDFATGPSPSTFIAKVCEIIVAHIPTAKDIYIYEDQTVQVHSAAGVKSLLELVNLDFVAKFYGHPIKANYIELFLTNFVSDQTGREVFSDKTTKWRSLDRTIMLSGGQRLRVSLLQHSGGKLGLVIRVIPRTIEKLDASMQLPDDVFERIQNPSGGFVIVCGPTGSGKTQLAMAIADYYNHTYSGHIEMIEDPTEYQIRGKRCVITQRQVGLDVVSYAQGMLEAKRHNPSFVMVGEIRDSATADASINMAESGAYLLATNHANTIPAMLRTLSGLASSGSTAANIDTVYKMLAGSVKAVVRVALLNGKDGTVYHRVYDTMVNVGQVTDALSRGNLAAIDQFLAAGNNVACTSMNTALIQLIKDGKVDASEALAKTSNYVALKEILDGA
jgi:twitching motility protein PilT